MDMARIRRRKAILLAAVLVSILVPLAFVRYEEPTRGLAVVKALAKIGSLVGTVLLVWQPVLGFRGVNRLFHEDHLWLVGVHEKAGAAGILLILLHPVFITVYYLWRLGRNPLLLDLSEPFSWFVLLGMTALALLGFVFVTSVLVRKRLGYGRWFATHLATYAVLPLVFVHSLPIGMTLRETPLWIVWAALAAVAAAVYVARLAHLAGWRSWPYEATRSRTLAEDVTELVLRPLEKHMRPEIGQFVYVRRGVAASMRPYSVAGYEEDTGLLTLVVKASGPASGRLQSTRAGRQMLLDGPYGVFSRQALERDRPIVMVAGGIGITALTRLARRLEERADRPAYLFYGNTHARMIVYRDELDALRHVRVVHVISDEPDYPGELGYVTADLLRRHVREPLPECDLLLCGPPVMIEKLEGQLHAAGVAKDQVHHELFGF